MTQKQLLEAVLTDLRSIKQDMPNGELKALIDDVKDLKGDMSDLKYTLLNPEDGVIVKTNQNSEFRRKIEGGEKDFAVKMSDIEDLKTWKEGVTKALWILFAGLAAVIIRLLTEVLNS